MSKDMSYDEFKDQQPVSGLKKFGIAAFFVIAGITFLGTQVDPPEQPVTPPSATIVAPAPAPRTVTVTEEVPVPTVPQACIDYLALVDTTIQSVYDYETAIGPIDQVLTDATKAIIDSDMQQLNDAKERNTDIANASVGALLDITDAKAPLQRLKAACDEAKD